MWYLATCKERQQFFYKAEEVKDSEVPDGAEDGCQGSLILV